MGRGAMGLVVALAWGCVPAATPTPIELAGCYRVNAAMDGGPRRIGREAPLPTGFEDGTWLCLDEERWGARGPHPNDPWGVVTVSWTVEPIQRAGRRVGTRWTSPPVAVPRCDDDGSSLSSLCCLDPQACAERRAVPLGIPLSFSVEEGHYRLEGGGVQVALSRSEPAEASRLRERMLRDGFAGYRAHPNPPAPPSPPPRTYAEETIAIEADDAPPPPDCDERSEAVGTRCIPRCSTREGPRDGAAVLQANSIPPSIVLIDGCWVGSTPVMGHLVDPGKHHVEFVHERLGSKLRDVVLAAGQRRTVTARFGR